MTPPLFEPRELTSSPNDLALLRRFYYSVYVPEFPDSDERESLENMERYLTLKAEGWYGRNNYHILLYLDGETPIGGSIMDYLAGPNVGVIEFLVVSSSLRRYGVGSRLLQWTEDTLGDDSRSAGHDGWSHIIAEMNDPFKTHDLADSIDPFERAMVWDRWGYKKARFPYVQPSLSPTQEPVRGLLLMCKPGAASEPAAIPAPLLQEAVYGYAKWAMRIDDPDSNHECRQMSRFLQQRDAVELLPLATYVGDERARRLAYTEVSSADPTNLNAALDIYADEFGRGPIAVPREQFRDFLTSGLYRDKPYAYHFFSISTTPGSPPAGIASFFTFPGAGFGGYAAFDKSIRGRGHLSELITVIERSMIADKRGARGWYCECEPAGDADQIFRKKGFCEVDIVYRQPPLPGQPAYPVSAAPVLHLLYKEFGDCFDAPRLRSADLLAALGWIFRVVYQIKDLEDSEYYKDLRSQLGNRDYAGWK